ncbi:TlpA disulfide reductase family protein [Rhodococcus sp. ARC_M6]|uniref:TlpA family protein disulfide reductase n=1 Tax=Rhodococcus sp. ARC_M6 TaxID=2928852 RepID=UPI001FB3F33B|nr:TlpA disulfide reductase family protein [Rhodococcus sp. ARC_M6]MCJ0905213.1 TlpA family protein disulfide reductase [Rhodococcus sp. ARC_M6]
MRTQWRSTVFVLAVVALLVAAMWPRERQSADVAQPPSAPISHVGESEPSDDASLAALAVAAALQPCPLPDPQGSPSEQLSGVYVSCLGSRERIDIGRALAGEPALINLWASWCAPCREEIPVLSAYAEEPGAVRVVGVNVQDSQSSALALLADLGVHYPSFGDADAVQRTLVAPPVLPLSFIVQRDGSVERITDPPVFRDKQQIRDAVARMVR